MVAPQGWYDPSDEELQEWLAILEGSLAQKFGMRPRSLKLGTWARLCGEFCAKVIESGKPDTLAGLRWLDQWAYAHGYVRTVP